MTEQFANNVQTTLNGAIASGATSLIVTSAAGFPSVGPFRMLIDAELFLCTARADRTCTVVPGAEGTTPAAHSTLAPVTLILTAGALRAVQSDQIAPITFTRKTNTSSAIYVIDGGGVPDYRILHARSGPTTYILPAPTDGRTIELQDITGAIESPGNQVILVPRGTERINGSPGFLMSTDNNFALTNGSPVVSGWSGNFTSTLAIGMSIVSDNQPAVNYLVASIESDNSLTLATNFSGETTTTALVTRTSLTFAANFGRLSIQSDGVDWYVKGDGTPTRVQFATQGVFVSPAGVYSATIVGCGTGGWGGTGGTTNKTGGGGGGGAIESRVTLSLVPNTAYRVTISDTPPTPSSFGNLAFFMSASSGASGDDANVPGAGGLCVAANNSDLHNFFASGSYGIALSSGGNALPGGGANGGTGQGQSGANSPTSVYSAVEDGYAHGTYGAGATGGAGPRGPAGAGGAGSADDVGLPGVNGPPGSGAGGGGGGSGPNGGGPPGHGGSGYLDVIYVL